MRSGEDDFLPRASVNAFVLWRSLRFFFPCTSNEDSTGAIIASDTTNSESHEGTEETTAEAVIDQISEAKVDSEDQDSIFAELRDSEVREEKSSGETSLDHVPQGAGINTFDSDVTTTDPSHEEYDYADTIIVNEAQVDSEDEDKEDSIFAEFRDSEGREEESGGESSFDHVLQGAGINTFDSDATTTDPSHEEYDCADPVIVNLANAFEQARSMPILEDSILHSWRSPDLEDSGEPIPFPRLTLMNPNEIAYDVSTSGSSSMCVSTNTTATEATMKSTESLEYYGENTVIKDAYYI